jgi:hypothetical protein
VKRKREKEKRKNANGLCGKEKVVLCLKEKVA